MKEDRRFQNAGYLLGVLVGLICLFILFLPGQEHLHASGPMNTGHEELSCAACHKEARGSIRQQLQANVKYLLGLRETATDFARRAVTNNECWSCHERPNDRHPVFRFFEPRFAEARDNLQPQHCNSCHLEHQGKRVTLAGIGYCVHCHEDTRLKNDPITIPHETLIAQKNWDTCLGCHDFHGNHVMETETDVSKVFPVARIRSYFAGDASPYSNTRHHKAKKEEVSGD